MLRPEPIELDLKSPMLRNTWFNEIKTEVDGDLLEVKILQQKRSLKQRSLLCGVNWENKHDNKIPSWARQK